MIKITKQQFLNITCSTYYKKRINKFWPKKRTKVSMCEFIKIARILKTKEYSIQYVIYKLDNQGWHRALHRIRFREGSTDRKIVSRYLDLFNKNKAKQK